MDPVTRAKGALAEAGNLGFDTVIIDSAGRLHIDDELMDELVAIRDVTDASDKLYVADAMTGQDAIKSAGEFNRRVGVTGVVLTKMDGDARGGAALSVVSVVGVPIAFVAWRAPRNLAVHPDRPSPCARMATCCRSIERAEAAIDQEDAAKLEKKIRSNEFARDFAISCDIRKMGPLEQIMGMLPGMGNLKALSENKPDEKQLGRIEAIIGSMTPDERAKRTSSTAAGASASRRAAARRSRSEPPAEAVRADAEDVEQLGGMTGLTGGGKQAAAGRWKCCANCDSRCFADPCRRV
jgi:signal recognition particle subunit SRP54